MFTLDEMIARQRRTRDARAALYNEHGEELNALRAKDTLTDDETTRAEVLKTKRAELAAEVSEADKRIDELEAEKRADDAISRMQAETHAVEGQPTVTYRAEVKSEPNPVYRRDNARQVSYFRDMWDARQGDRGAIERLAQSQERAATTVAGSGGEFAPPAWLVEDFVEYARADRVVADVIGSEPLEAGISSINLPKISTGSGTAVQQTQNTTITESGISTTSVSSGISTITGKQKISIQELRQTGIAMDAVILADLASSYAASLDVQVINGSNANGQLRGLVTAGTTVTYTTTQPAVVSSTVANSFYSKGLGALSAMASTRKRPGTHWFMTPTRWYWVLSALDSSNRPIVASAGAGYNQAAVTAGEPVAEGYGGVFLGLPVWIDGNIPSNLGAGTNQDVVLLTRTSDLRFWESPLELASFDATHADDNAVLFRALGFAAFIPDRHQASVQVISGTGLVAPTF